MSIVHITEITAHYHRPVSASTRGLVTTVTSQTIAQPRTTSANTAPVTWSSAMEEVLFRSKEYLSIKNIYKIA